MAFMAKDKIVRTGDDLNLATLVALQSDATVLGNVADAVGNVVFDRLTKVAKVELNDDDAAAGIFSWQNPEATAILITRVVIDVATISTGACTIDVGVSTGASPASSDNLLDGFNANAGGVFDNIENKGSNGKTRQKLASEKWVTGSTATDTAAGFSGYAYIYYTLV